MIFVVYQCVTGMVYILCYKISHDLSYRFLSVTSVTHHKLWSITYGSILVTKILSGIFKMCHHTLVTISKLSLNLNRFLLQLSHGLAISPLVSFKIFIFLTFREPNPIMLCSVISGRSPWKHEG